MNALFVFERVPVPHLPDACDTHVSSKRVCLPACLLFLFLTSPVDWAPVRVSRSWRRSFLVVGIFESEADVIRPKPKFASFLFFPLQNSFSIHDTDPTSSSQVAKELLHWDRPFKTVRSGSFQNGDIVWFPEGGLNASYNCVDRWAFAHPDKVRITQITI